MFKVSLLFLAVGILVLAFAVFVPAKDSSITINIYDTFFIISSISLFKFLGLLGLIFAGLYYFTEQMLYSKTWSIMHLISFLCLIVNLWTWGFVERVYFGNIESQVSGKASNLAEVERFYKIQQFYVGSFIMLLVMQFVYVLNLLFGIMTRNRSSEDLD
ncbi:hypothetical protein [Sphingobacterium sp.]|uniref:hypothetical protein n=1 Tax=Sphingobacterium sp. TaxID=341027 RepID=UPI0028AF7442|nr:hypothetical protein [Sphingobacterium sp.]